MMRNEPDDLPEKLTIGEKYGPAMAITDAAEAKAYFRRCVRHTRRYGGKDRGEAERIERINIGYYAGYYDHEARVRVERLFLTKRPVFGAAAARNGSAAPK
jgi:hypothetical protein